MGKTKLSKTYDYKQVLDFIEILYDDGAILYDPDLQLKSPKESILFDVKSLKIGFTQIFLLHKSFSPENFKVKPVNNIHSGKIYMLDRGHKYGFVTILIPNEDDKYSIEVSINSFFWEEDNDETEYYDPTPELKSYLKKVRSIKRKL